MNHIIGHTDMGIPLQESPEAGPTIVLRRDQQIGAYVYCRNASAETIRLSSTISTAKTAK